MKKIISTILVAITLLLSVGMAFSVKAGASDQQLLYLYEKEPVDWTIVEDGAWGKMRLDSDDFVFNGHGLEPGVEYALIVYDQGDDETEDEWPGEGPVLGYGIANDEGNVHIKGDMYELYEAKIWLVPASDINEGGIMIAWNPEEILFENERVTN